MSWCLIDDQPVVLDVQQDRYCLLTGNTAVALAELGRSPALDKRAVLERLATLKIVSAERSEISPPCRHPLPQREIQHLPSPSWLRLTEAMVALMRGVGQRRWSLAKRVDEFRARKARTLATPNLAPDLAVAVASAFDRSRRLTLGFDQCLVRAFALATTLLAQGYRPAIIFGVQLRPFAAHCWVELDGCLMDDRVAHVSLFTPNSCLVIAHYVIIVSDRPHAGPVPDPVSAVATRLQLIPHSLTCRAWLLTRPDTTWRSIDAGVIIGDAYPREHDRPASSVFDNFWGGYVAVLLPEDRGGAIEIWRDPSGAVGCYYARAQEWTIVASNAGDLARAGVIAAEIDWRGLAAHLTFSQLRTPRTAICGVHELLAGGQLRVGKEGAPTQDMKWSPWAYAEPKNMIRNPADASSAVRAAILDAVAARLGGKGRAILRLSGGLDSSILAAAMKQVGHDFLCLNYRTRHASGDERPYARQVADHLGVQLYEVELDPARIDPLRSGAHDIPRPTIFSFSQAHAHQLDEVIRHTGATAIVDGGGGDNVFCYLHSAATVADAVRLEPPLAWWRAACDMSDLSKASLATIGRATIAKLRSGHRYLWQPVDLWLNQDFAPASAFQHPWLCTPKMGLPGTLRHIANIVQIQNHLDAGSLVALPVFSPLLTQPVMEACLRVPSYLWARGGINRRVARDAFADYLPEKIVWRRDKGTPTSVVGELFETHRDRLRDHLLGGVLASAGFLDRPRLERVFVQNRVAQDITYSLLVRLADAESWASAWLSRSDQPRALA